MDHSFFVFLMGIFTYTFSCHVDILRAWVYISEKSSENTSKEIGLSVMVVRISLANCS